MSEKVSELFANYCMLRFVGNLFFRESCGEVHLTGNSVTLVNWLCTPFQKSPTKLDCGTLEL